MIENEIRTERGGRTDVHLRVVINYGPDFGLEFPTDRQFVTLADAKHFITRPEWKEMRKLIRKRFRAISGTKKGTPARWSVLQYAPVRVDVRPI